MQPLTPDALRMWLHCLADLTPEQVLSAIAAYNREYTGFPKPAVLRKYAGRPTTEDRAGIAWQFVSKAVTTVNHQQLDFSDGVVNAAIRQMGGWRLLTDGAEGSLVYRRKEFMEAYERIMRTGIGDPAPLSGSPAGVQGIQQIVIPLTETGRLPRVEQSPAGSTPQLATHLRGIGDIEE